MVFISKDELLALIKESIKTLHQNDRNDGVEKFKSRLSLAELSKYIHLAPQTIYGLVHKNSIPYSKKGKKLFFEKIEIDAWLDDGRKLTNQDIKELREGVNNRI